MSFETDVARIEEIASRLGNPDTPLEESLALFEEGITLSKRLEKTLDEAKRKVETVLGNGTDSVEIAPFEQEQQS